MKRFVIYTAIIGQYDKPLQPLVVDDRFDYVLFSDHIPEGENGVWQIRRIDYTNPVQPKIARFVKTNPENLLGEYEASLWLDANIRISGQEIYDRFVELFEKGIPIASVKHLGYDCVYEEMFSVLDFRYESEKVVLDWGHQLRKRKFPRHQGMFETGLLFRIHSNDEVKKVDSKWWSYIERYSKRDQLSFTVVLDEVGVNCECFLPQGVTVRSSKGLEFVKHADESVKFNANDKKAWLMHHYYKHHEDKGKVNKLYYWIYGRRNPRLWAAILGQFYRIKDRVMK